MNLAQMVLVVNNFIGKENKQKLRSENVLEELQTVTFNRNFDFKDRKP